MNTRYQDTTAPASGVEPWMVESRVPVGPSRFETHVKVPVALAGIVALAVTFGLVIGTWRFGWSWDVTWIGGLVVFIVMLAWRLLWVDHLSWRLETITGRELDGKPGIGKPHDVTLYNMHDYTAPPRTEQAAGGEGTPTKQALLAFTMSCYVMRKTSERAHGIRPWQRGRYKDFRDALLQLGIADWRDDANHQLGWDLVVDQDTAIQQVAEHIL
jgi:hypothetical protein